MMNSYLQQPDCQWRNEGLYVINPAGFPQQTVNNLFARVRPERQHLLTFIETNSRHPNRRRTDICKFVSNSGGVAFFVCVAANKLETMIGEYRFTAATSRM
jgi:hypothetical protein